jgi:hypothetical protein
LKYFPFGEKVNYTEYFHYGEEVEPLDEESKSLGKGWMIVELPKDADQRGIFVVEQSGKRLEVPRERVRSIHSVTRKTSEGQREPRS